jgi:hypothetical protein
VSERERIERIQREVDSHEGCTRDDCSYNAVEDVRWLLKTLAAANAATERVERERDRLARLMEGRCGTHEDRLAELLAALEALMPHVRHTGSCAEQAVASLLRREQPQCVCGRDAAAHSARALLPRPGDQP